MVTTVTVADINEVRGITGAGMMDCKKALVACNGDKNAAIKILREQGLAIQVKRADKESKEGTIDIVQAPDGAFGMAEVNTETDFVAKTDRFQAFAKLVAETAAKGDEKADETLNSELVALVAATGENAKIRRFVRFAKQGEGKIASYIHMGGKIGVLVELGCTKAETTENPEFNAVLNELTLHVAASNPLYLKSDEVPQNVLDDELEVYRKQVEGKPANIIENILKGKVKKFYSEVCFLDQPYSGDDKKSVTQILAELSKKLGDTVTIRRYARFQLGAK